MRSMNACMNSFCSASAAEPYIYISPNVTSGFLKSLLIFLFRVL